jgi:hypothetical protein
VVNSHLLYRLSYRGTSKPNYMICWIDSLGQRLISLRSNLLSDCKSFSPRLMSLRLNRGVKIIIYHAVVAFYSLNRRVDRVSGSTGERWI